MSVPPTIDAVRRASAAAAFFLLWPGIAASLAAGPENVAVVVNAESWASKAVANDFIHLRKIPAGNVIYLQEIPSFESVDVETFREKVLKPVLETVERRKLTDQIDCIAYSPDLPWAVDVRKDIGERKLPRFFTPVAAINGLTYLYRDVLAKDPAYLRLDINRYMRRPLRSLGEGTLGEEDQRRHDEAARLMMDKKWVEAAPLLFALAKSHPRSAHVQYNLACCLARRGKPDEAMDALKRAAENGWMSHRHARKDDDLVSLRDRKDFQGLLDGMKDAVFDIQPTRGFRSAYEWNEQGEVAPGGKRYMLSTMLAVTSGRGNSVREAISALRRSAAADGACPKGAIYYMVNEDIRSSTRDGSFHCAVEKLKALGVKAEILEGVLPKDKPDVEGAMIGIASFDWRACGSAILPGAICEHLTSAGGVMHERSIQTPLSEFIRYGAAGSSGTVTEPYAIQAKFPTAFVHVHYARGCTLAEAFYQSVHGPYQLLIVGDPLCRPWARIPDVTVDGITPGATIRGKVALRPGIKWGAVKSYELFVDGLRAAACQPSHSFELDTAQFCDGYHELRVVAIAADPVETQGAEIIPIEISNHNHKLVVTPPSAGDIRWDRPVRLGARLVGARKITFLHNARPMGTIAGEQGTVEIDPRQLGLGQVVIQAVGVLKDKPDTRVCGRPIQLNVAPSPALPGVKLDPSVTLAEGLELIRKSGTRIAVYDTYPNTWLDGFVDPGEAVELTGCFDAPADDVYQFQANGNFPVEIAADSTPVKGESFGGGWTFFPVSLAAGRHTLRVRGTVPAKPRLDIRFGGPGAHHLSGLRFSHPAQAGRK